MCDFAHIHMKMRNKKLSSLSVFFPAYNEQGNIAEAIRQALKAIPKVAKKYEIIVVNDGSTDKTKQEALKMAARYPNIVRVVSQKNKGYGGALKRGFAESRYDWIFFTDADLQFDLKEIKKLLKPAQTVDLVLGYRLKRADGRKRILLAKMLKVWNRVWFNYPLEIKDTDCAFKLIRRHVMKSIEPFISDGAMISTELILKAKYAGFVWHQVGVSHYNRLSGRPTGSNWRVIWRAVKDTVVLYQGLSEKPDISESTSSAHHPLY